MNLPNLGLVGLAMMASQLLTVSAIGQSNGDAIPKHLGIARDLVEHVSRDNNAYVLGGRSIIFPGEDATNRYAVKADCSGFLLALFDRSGYATQSEMGFLKQSAKRKRPRAEDFVYSIESAQGFRRIKVVEDMRPGDLLAHAILNAEDQEDTGTTGHVFLINSLPKKIAPKNPIVAGTNQFLVSVIDSNDERIGEDDSRAPISGAYVPGVGSGTIRLYTDAKGELVGWARTFKKTNRFFSYSPQFPSDTKLRKAAVGRVVASS